MADEETLIHAFMSSKLNYCNLFSGLTQAITETLQRKVGGAPDTPEF